MRKNAFTLIEIVIGIVLTGIILLFLYQAIDNLTKSNKFYLAQEKEIDKKNKILKTLYSDILEAKSIQFQDLNAKSFSIVALQTKNSVYGISYPYVTWLVLKDENSIIRLESPDPITLPLPSDKLYRVRSDEMLKECEIFKVMRMNNNILSIYIKQKNEKPIMYQIFKEL